MKDMDELLGIVDNTTMPMNVDGDAPPAQEASAPAPQPTTATQQAAPGTTPPVKVPKGPQVVSMPTVVPRGSLTASAGSSDSGPSVILNFTSKDSFEENLSKLLGKDLELAQHDRALAIALLQTHLDRAEVLDSMALSMPVATVISDNSGVILKSLELAMKAGERVHKTAQLLVDAQKNSDSTALAAIKVQLERNKNKDGWGEEAPP